MRITIFSPKTVGSVASRRSSVRLFTRSERRPSCGTRFSAMFRSPITFRRLMRPPWMLFGRVHDLVQDAVHAEPDAHILLGRLDVDVRRSVRGRLRHDRLHELDDRRVLDRRLDSERSASSSSASAASEARASTWSPIPENFAIA